MYTPSSLWLVVVSSMSFAGTDFHLVEGVYLCAQSISGYKHGKDRLAAISRARYSHSKTIRTDVCKITS